jgi:Spy/CpxP family protein refolding chaperone
LQSLGFTFLTVICPGVDALGWWTTHDGSTARPVVAARLPEEGTMSPKTLSVALAAILAAGTHTAASARGPDGPPIGRERGPRFGPGHGPLGPRFAEELGLSDEQKAQLESLRKKNEETLEPLADAARQSHETFRTALESDNPDSATVGQAALAMHAAEKALRAAHEASFEQVKAILTEEQRVKFEAARERRGPHHGKRGPRPPDAN